MKNVITENLEDSIVISGRVKSTFVKGKSKAQRRKLARSRSSVHKATPTAYFYYDHAIVMNCLEIAKCNLKTMSNYDPELDAMIESKLFLEALVEIFGLSSNIRLGVSTAHGLYKTHLFNLLPNEPSGPAIRLSSETNVGKGGSL